MEIITEFPLWRAVEKELRTSFQLQRETELARERQAAAQAKEGNGKVVGKGGLELRKLASIPGREFFQLTKKYGQDALHNDEFLGDFKKHNPHLTTNFCPDRKRLKSVSR